MNDINKKDHGLGRRTFMKWAGLSAAGLSMGFPAGSKWAIAEANEGSRSSTKWIQREDGYEYFVQDNIKTGWLNEGYILGKVDNKWFVYKTAEAEKEFQTWWLEEKLYYYDELEAAINEGRSFNLPNGGHHHPMLATYGNKYSNRGDSAFHLNVTPKGYTLIPKAEYIRQIIDEVNELYETAKNIPADIFDYRRNKYSQTELWDRGKFATLEVYSGHPIDDEDPMKLSFKETHTFQNVMANPMATLAYMSLFNTTGEQSYFFGEEGHTPTFEFRGFCWMISPYNPDLTQYEKDVSEYLNQAFSKYHGLRDDFITNIFVICEEFNNSPTDSDKFGLGKRVVPEFTYGSSIKQAFKKLFGKS